MHISGVTLLLYSVYKYNCNFQLINLEVVERENQRS